jgi:hypothetical protein
MLPLILRKQIVHVFEMAKQSDKTESEDGGTV